MTGIVNPQIEGEETSAAANIIYDATPSLKRLNGAVDHLMFCDGSPDHLCYVAKNLLSQFQACLASIAQGIESSEAETVRQRKVQAAKLKYNTSSDWRAAYAAAYELGEHLGEYEESAARLRKILQAGLQQVDPETHNNAREALSILENKGLIVSRHNG